MENAIDKTNFIFGVFIAGLTTIFGEYWILFAGFLVLNLVDWISGTIKARYYIKSSSTYGAKGILKKVGYWVVIGIAFFISSAFVEMGESIGVNLRFVSLFGWLTLAMYLVNEIRSVLENLVEIGVEVPEFLIKGLDITKKLMEDKTGGENECQ